VEAVAGRRDHGGFPGYSLRLPQRTQTRVGRYHSLRSPGRAECLGAPAACSARLGPRREQRTAPPTPLRHRHLTLTAGFAGGERVPTSGWRGWWRRVSALMLGCRG
jgi:hypothetical protein